MMKVTKNDFLFSIATIFSVWFVCTGYIWIYWMAAIISYPFGIASFLIWLHIKADGKKRNKLIIALLLIGFATSLLVLLIALLRH
ncbi:hypothetical protein [Pedobacter helvus]|uniref:Uncharacterized protein n=1 Tax=Pedobacter helvus TaxID=2563444 RepID=A0ABW9JLE9_9SPHI|nr:hypothetical protein [Pedobacter ureilyticus]